MIKNTDAVLNLCEIHHPSSGIYISGECKSDLSGVTLLDGATLSFTFNDVLARKKELQDAEPMKVLREHRDRRLKETDWWCCSDRTPTQAQLDYRTALRDLPANSTPSLNEDNKLTSVDWPTKPE